MNMEKNNISKLQKFFSLKQVTSAKDCYDFKIQNNYELVLNLFHDIYFISSLGSNTGDTVPHIYITDISSFLFFIPDVRQTEMSHPTSKESLLWKEIP